MGKSHDKLVNDAINANGPADQLHLRVTGIVEDEVVPVEIR